MALEDLTGTGKFINALQPAWPVDDDWVDEGDNHIRGIKNVLRNSFPATDTAVYWSNVQARFPDGTVTAPGISWTGDTDSGWFRAGNDTAYSVNGVAQFAISSDRVSSAIAHRFVAGLGSAPGISWAAESNSGFCLVSPGVTGLSILGTVKWTQSATQFALGGGFAGTIADLPNAPLKLNATAGTVTGITFSTQYAVWGITVRNESSLWFGADGSAGPAALAGFSAVLTKVGVMTARNFSTATTLRRGEAALSGALPGVLKLRGVRYVDAETGRAGIGVGVEEVEAGFPELVSEATPEIGKGLNLMGLVGPLIEAIRELEGRVRLLEARCR